MRHNRKKRKKVVFILNNFAIGGVERLLLNITTKLSETNEIVVISTLGTGPLRDDFKVPIYYAGPKFNYDRTFFYKLFWIFLLPITFFKLLCLLIYLKPKTVITSLYHADILGIFAAWCTFVPKRIVVQHDIQKFKGLRKYLRLFFAIRLATHYVAVSKTVSVFLRTYWKVFPSKIHVIYNAISIQSFQNPIKQLSNEITLGIIGRLEAVKGHIYLLQALDILKNKNNITPKTLIIGGGSLEKDLKSYASKHSLDHVEFLGYKEDIPAMLTSIDVLIVPSVEEGFGLVVLEGIFSQKLIIASDIDAFREVITDQNNGLLVESQNPQAFASALQDILLDSQKIQEYHKSLQQWIEKYGNIYHIDRVVEQYSQII